MRIGVNCFALLSNIGGIKQYFFHLFNALLTTEDEQDEYIFFYSSRNFEELLHLSSTRWQDRAILLHDELEITPYADQLDLYFCPFGWLWPRPLPIPTVVTLVDVQEAVYPEYFTAVELYTRAYHYIGSTKMADRVMTISHFSRQLIVKHHRISPQKITVAHLCADERFYRAAQIAQAPAELIPDENFIFYPANTWPHKNHDMLLRALQWLKTERKLTIPIVFTGNNDVLNSYPLRQKVSDYGLDQQVHILGYVRVEELAYLYANAKMLVFPSLFEGFGIPVVEAMAAGCPVATSSSASLSEVGGDAVEYFDPVSPESIGRAIEKIWNNAGLRQQLIERGKQRARNFSATTLAHIHQTAFQEAAASFSKLRYAWNYWVYQWYHHRRIHLKYRKVLQTLRKGVN